MEIDIKATFTLDDLLAELGASEEMPGYRTTEEWAAALGIKREKMLALLHEARRRGVLSVLRAKREGLDGVVRSVPVYKINLRKGA